MRAARTAKLVAWLASTAMFAMVACFVCAFCVLIFTFQDCRSDQPAEFVLKILLGVFEVASLALAIREWRRTDGAIPSYLWWLVLGFGPGAIAVIWAFVALGGS